MNGPATFPLSPSVPPSRAPVAPQTVSASYANLLHRLHSIIPPTIFGEADGNDMRDISEHMVAVADAMDAYFSQIGRLIQSNAPVLVDQSCFEHPTFEAIAGNALFEISRAGEALDQDRVL